MLIGIDGNEANVEQRLGSNRYAHQLLLALSQLGSQHQIQVHLKNPPLKDLPESTTSWQYQVYGPKRFWSRWRLPLQLYFKQPRPQVYFSPGHYSPKFCPVPKVVSILDLGFLEYPKTFKPRIQKRLERVTRESVQSADHILAISKFTKQEIVRFYQIDPNKITVTHLGPGMNLTPASPKQIKAIKTQLNLKRDYFLFTGTRQPRKNLDRLIQAFNQLIQTNDQVDLVIVGKIWHQFAETELDQLKSERIHIIDYLEDQDLNSLRAGALALVYPSLYEGFGMPVLEAMTQGVLVAASKISSIPEIIGKSPLVFDPESVDQISQALNQVVNLSESSKQKLIKQGKMRAKQFSWQKCAQQTLAVLENTGKRN